MVLTTRVWPAKKGTVSLRSTIPEAVVEQLGLKAGDELVWEMKVMSTQPKTQRRMPRESDLEQAVLVRKVKKDAA